MSEYLIISTSVDLIRVPSEGIVFISSDGNYSTFMFTSGESRVVSLQLGQVERILATQLSDTRGNFLRVGKSLIINSEYISYINVPKQQLVVSDLHLSSHTLNAGKEVLKNLKEKIEKDLR